MHEERGYSESCARARFVSTRATAFLDQWRPIPAYSNELILIQVCYWAHPALRRALGPMSATSLTVLHCQSPIQYTMHELRQPSPRRRSSDQRGRALCCRHCYRPPFNWAPAQTSALFSERLTPLARLTRRGTLPRTTRARPPLCAPPWTLRSTTRAGTAWRR